MPLRGLHRVAAVLSLLAVAGPATATATAATATTAGSPIAPARSAAGLLLSRADLGRGWTVSAPAPRHVPAITCPSLHLGLHGGAADPAAAATPTYAASTSGPFVAQTAYRYATAGQAQQVWRGVDRSAFASCLAQAVTAGSTGGVHFVVDRRLRRGAPHLPGATAAAFRVTATATESGQSVDAYLDALLVRVGSAVSEVSFSTLVAPPPAALELRVAHRVAARLDKKTS